MQPTVGRSGAEGWRIGHPVGRYNDTLRAASAVEGLSLLLPWHGTAAIRRCGLASVPTGLGTGSRSQATLLFSIELAGGIR